MGVGGGWGVKGALTIALAGNVLFQMEFALCASQHSFLHTSTANQAVHSDLPGMHNGWLKWQFLARGKFCLPCLAHTVASIFGLFVIVWVEVNIMQDDCVGSSQIDAESSCLCREQEHKDFMVLVKTVNQLLPAVKGTHTRVVLLV